MNVNEMTKKDFEELPLHAKWDEEIICDSLVIIPGRIKDMHDSGYRTMTFVAIQHDEPVCLISGCSDVINFDGIGGYGYRWLDKYGTVPKQIPPSAWNIDCLPKSGLLRIWPDFCRMKTGHALSSFSIYVLPKKLGEHKRSSEKPHLDCVKNQCGAYRR